MVHDLVRVRVGRDLSTSPPLFLTMFRFVGMTVIFSMECYHASKSGSFWLVCCGRESAYVDEYGCVVWIDRFIQNLVGGRNYYRKLHYFLGHRTSQERGPILWRMVQLVFCGHYGWKGTSRPSMGKR